MIFNSMIPLILLLFIIKFVFGIKLECYSNAYLILPPSAILYPNMTLQSCRCASIAPTIFGFQYDSNNQSCYTFKNDSSRSNLRVKSNSQVCFLNKTTALSTVAPSSTTALPYPPLTVSISNDGNNYYYREILNINNNVPLTSLLVYVSVTRSQNPTNPSSYTNFPGDAMNLTIAYTTDRIIFTFQLIQGKTISTGSHQLAVQYDLNNKVQPNQDDTYQIKIDSYQDIFDHY